MISLKVKVVYPYRRFEVAFKALIRGDYVIKAAFNDDAALKAYQACFENAPEVTLQIIIIIVEWDQDTG